MTTEELIVTKSKCTGCEACSQICPKSAIVMKEDKEGFRYPTINEKLCINCGLCKRTCPIENMPLRYTEGKYVFGGYVKDKRIREESTSGGAFSAVVDSWCDNNYVIFGAISRGLSVEHGYITDKNELHVFRKSKYSQSSIGSAYKDAKSFLKQGRKVVFSGTPCQIAGLRSFLKKEDTNNLLTIEVICEGVPTPLYIRSMNKYFKKKYGSPISDIDYRYKDSNRWDYEVMNITYSSLHNPTCGTIKCDRWFNPFWSIWLQHLMSRPSCYECRFTNISRCADITLGDLWGVHIYCPELYGKNRGASLIVCNTDKGKQALDNARQLMFGHELAFSEALKYQGPMRKSIAYNDKRTEFMSDVIAMDFKSLNKKWAIRPTFKLLFQKYIWGNHHKMFVWNLKNKLFKW